ncbi:hypothetical protein JTB14_034804 [Gonioctena quinquepunctata]|nr:hypothetical protein JTB14_034804 [Gonioctena quinquepunctata]
MGVNIHAESSENSSLKANTGQVDPFDNPQPSASSCTIKQSDFPNLGETVQLPVGKLPVQKLPLKETTSTCAANEISTTKNSQRLIRSHLQELSPISRLKLYKISCQKVPLHLKFQQKALMKMIWEIDDKNKKEAKLELNEENRGKVGSSKRNKSVEIKTVVRKKKESSGSSADEEWYCIICDENTR